MNTVFLAEDQKPAALAALYNASRHLGLGWLHATPQDLTVDEATAMLQEQKYFDYLRGRVMKLDFKRDPLDLRLYDRDNGNGAAEMALRAANVIT